MNNDILNDKLAMTTAGNMGNMVGQLSLQVARLQVKLQEKDQQIQKDQNLIAERQSQIEGLRGERKNGQRFSGTSNKHGKRKS